MEGQWQGYVAEGEFVTVEIDDDGKNYSGRLYLFRDHFDFIVVVSFVTQDKGPIKNLEVEVEYRRLAVQDAISPEELRSTFPDRSFPETAWMSLELDQGDLLIAMRGINAKGQEETHKTRVPRGCPTDDSNLLPDAEVVGWDEFKRQMAQLEPDRFIFRGQPVQKKASHIVSPHQAQKPR